MSKIAFVFPGQGSQTVGMCKAFYDEYPVVKQIFEEADDALGYSISKMCFEGPAEDLKLTANTQPAILTASTACAAVLKEHGVSCDIAAGHSLGEYSGGIGSLIICFVPRILIGVVPFYVYRLVKKLSKNNGVSSVGLVAAGLSGALTNTLLVMNLIFVFFRIFYYLIFSKISHSPSNLF